jgi:hypothetical protein
VLGRFLSPDTVMPDPANPQNLNRYGYVGNNPLRFVDPTGHAGESAWDLPACGTEDFVCRTKPDGSVWKTKPDGDKNIDWEMLKGADNTGGGLTAAGWDALVPKGLEAFPRPGEVRCLDPDSGQYCFAFLPVGPFLMPVHLKDFNVPGGEDAARDGARGTVRRMTGESRSGGGLRAAAGELLRKLGLEGVDLAGRSYNSGRKSLEQAGFRLEEVTRTGRKVFVNRRTGAKVYFDAGDALATGQKPHWHIVDNAGQEYGRLGRPVESYEGAAHIPAR